MDADENQPGDPEQLARVVQVAERFYESSRLGIIVYWDETAHRYRLGYQSQYRPSNTTEVLRIPK